MLGITDVMRAYDRGGGGMLAGALAYFAFFTMVPALLLFVSVLGILVEDQGLRAQLIDILVDQLDPVSEVATFVIDGLAGNGRTGTIVGVLGLLWGASGFYGALEGAMARMFPGPGTRDFLQTRVRGVLTVVLILASMLAAVVLIFALPFLQQWLEARCADLDGVAVALLAQACAIDFGSVGAGAAIVATMALAGLAALVVYVVVPQDGASLRQALPPALVVGAVIGLFTSLFGWLAPLLVRQWLTLGIVGSVFISLVWFNLVFQALLYGAAFARLRRDRERSRLGPPSL
jgi:membrane protein